MKNLCQLLLVVCLFVFGGQDVFAAKFASKLVTVKNSDVILDVAKGYGSAVLEEDDVGDPMITGRLEGHKYLVLWEACDDECSVLRFQAGWSDTEATVDTVNTWNEESLFGKAFIDDEGDPVVEMTVNLDHGVSRKNLDDTFEWWREVLRSFVSEVVDGE